VETSGATPIFLVVAPRPRERSGPAMRCVHLIPVIRLSFLLAAALCTGCEHDQEDRNFFYHGWTRPRMTEDDQDYFYTTKKSGRSGGPEVPRLPSGEEL
jgi:hypothetical protein